MPLQARAPEVLVVDPDIDARGQLQRLLRRAGIRVNAATNAERALALVGIERPTLVLSEVEFPGGMSGYELLRALRDLEEGALALIFVTGARTEAIDRVGGLLMGADDYIVKPFDEDELLARVRRSIDRAGGEAPRNPGVARLTPREMDVLRLLAAGRTQPEIARELVISSRTVATHIQRILVKLGVHSRAQAVAVAHREHLVRG